MKLAEKNPLLIAVAPAIMLSLTWWWIIPWWRSQYVTLPELFPYFLVSAAVWFMVTWWALHQLVFQLAALWPVQLAEVPQTPTEPVRFAVFYLACDDFIEECCRSCLEQNYPQDAYQVAICDDSRTDLYESAVRAWCARHPRVRHVRRSSRRGYKAGNLNHAFRQVARDRCDWVVIVDADQVLPQNFLADMAPFLVAQPPEVAFVQAGRDPLPPEVQLAPSASSTVLKETPFQRVLQADLRLFVERDMACRRRFGFFPFLGHGGAIRQSAWKALRGFPHRVSEDYAFTLKANQHGYHGERIDHVRSWEVYPHDFGAFLVRFSKFARGAAELLRLSFPCFLKAQGSVTEKWDALMLIGTYALMPLIVVNVFLSTFLCRQLWSQQYSVLEPRLPYLFLGMALLSFPVLMSINPLVGRAVQHWFWAFAVYTGALPLAAGNFLVHLVKQPVFRPTPKPGQESPRFRTTTILTILLGLAGIILAWHWWSPFSFILAAAASAWLLFPSHFFLHVESSWPARLARTLVYVPGLTFLCGLFAMWLWATS
jgi:cellulose synthase/poly-beta-1,6-N-acetylglucosamine synthase-like glycosyltransferase